jgi:hypothetical protein
LYTDGLIEDRYRDISDGLAILAETLRRSGPSSAGQTCADVHAALLGTAARRRRMPPDSPVHWCAVDGTPSVARLG